MLTRSAPKRSERRWVMKFASAIPSFWRQQMIERSTPSNQPGPIAKGPRQSEELRQAIEAIKGALQQSLVHISDPSEQGEWMRLLYEQRSGRFSADNQTIWQTGGIMVPVALAAFAVPAQAEITSGWVLVILAAASIALMLLWAWVSETHRAFQNKSMAVMIAIEQEIAHYFDPIGYKIIDLPRNLRFIVGPKSGQAAIWLFTVLVFIGWISVIIVLRKSLCW